MAGCTWEASTNWDISSRARWASGRSFRCWTSCLPRVRIGPEDSTGGIWIGTNNGLVRIWIGGATTAIRIVQGIVSGFATDALRHRGRLYVATTAGVARLRPADAKTLTNAELKALMDRRRTARKAIRLWNRLPRR